jgi:hypothetical protein
MQKQERQQHNSSSNQDAGNIMDTRNGKPTTASQKQQDTSNIRDDSNSRDAC